jgi:hypothetical protein
MPSESKPKRFKTFRIGPKNQRLLEPGESVTADESGYLVIVETGVPLERLTAQLSIEIVVEDPEIATDFFHYPDEGRLQLHFELFEFPKRADYGRNGVDETFVRDRLNLLGFRPATFIELLCFGGHLRDLHKYDWFEGRSIVALGSVAKTTHVIKHGFLFWKPITATYRHYPEFICIAGRPVDQIKMTTTDKNKNGNWPNEVLFLGVDVK